MLLIILALMCCCLVVGAVLFLVFTSESGGASSSVPGVPKSYRAFGLAKSAEMDGRIPPVVEKDGKQAFEVVLRKGEIHPEGTNTSMYMTPKGIFPANEARVTFKIYFDEAFPWTKTATQRVGGKLGGFMMGEGKASGGVYTEGAASYRVTFQEDRGVVAYVYPELRDSFRGAPSWAQLDQRPELQRISSAFVGVHIFETKGKAMLRVRPGWNTIEMYMKLNTPGKHDGIIELAVNGESRRFEGIRYRYSPNMRIERFHLSPFFGGGDKSYAPPRDIRLWYADFGFASSS